MKKYLLLSIILLISTEVLYSQNRTIKGRVISDHFETLAFIPIKINDTVEVGRTDLNGFFQIDIPTYTERLLLDEVGIDLTIINIKNDCNELEIVMLLSSTYDFMTPKKVDRLRLKRFQKIPELHKEAFERGFFKADKACYTQDFIPDFGKHTK